MQVSHVDPLKSKPPEYLVLAILPLKKWSLSKRKSISHSLPGDFFSKANIIAFPKITILPMGLCLFTLSQSHKELGDKPGTVRLVHLWGRTLIPLSGQAYIDRAETPQSRFSGSPRWQTGTLSQKLHSGVDLSPGDSAGPAVGLLTSQRRRVCGQSTVFLGS